MRVIAGSAGGTRLARVPAGTRPLSDRAREGLFASLGESVAGATCVDLFAGTGAVGIEALSRGAARCLFVDSGAGAVRTIRANLDRTGLADRGRVVRADVGRAVAGLSGRFDLAVLDPPYAYPRPALRDHLGLLGRLLTEEARVVLTRPTRDPTDVIPVHWTTARRLTYGDTQILICREGS